MTALYSPERQAAGLSLAKVHRILKFNGLSRGVGVAPCNSYFVRREQSGSQQLS